MTDRAKRAAAVLLERGWSIDSLALTKACHACTAELENIHRYCWQCGAMRPPCFADDSLQDIEAAIKAANWEEACATQ